MWVVAVASTLSALWILLANGWMQKPRGYEIVAGKAQLVVFGALIWNPYAWIKLFHTIMAAYTLASFFIMGISAIQLLRGRQREMFKRSFRIGATLGIVDLASASSSPAISRAAGGRSTSRPSWPPWSRSGRPRSAAPFYLLAAPPSRQADDNIVEALAIPSGAQPARLP